MESMIDEETQSYEAWRMAIDLVVGPFAITMSLVAMFFIYAISKTRQFTFNLYVVFILLPDSMMNLVEGSRCIYEALHNGSIPFGMCYVRNFMVLFYYYSNLTVNAFIAKEVYNLVLNSYHRKRTKPPTTKKVLQQVAISYFFAILIGIWFIVPVPWSPLTVTNDPVCGTTFGSQNISGVSGLLICTFLSLPTLLYVFWRGYQIWSKQLLPLRGKTRALGLYFCRIVVTFIAFYAPMLFIALAKNATPQEDHDSTRYFVLLSIFSLIIPFQNIVTIHFLMQKDDISTTIRGYLSKLSVVFAAAAETHGSEWRTEDTYGRRGSEGEQTAHTAEQTEGDKIEMEKASLDV